MPLLARLKRSLHADNRGKFKAPWILANLGYDVIYTIATVGIFSRYGINVWVYVCYIAGFSMLYAWSTFELVGALVDGRSRRAYWSAGVSAISFLAPDVYLIVATHNVPWEVWAILGVYVATTAIAAIVALRRKAAGRRQQEGANESPAGEDLAQTK